MSEGILQALLGIGVALLVLQVLVLARAAHSRETLDAGLRDVQRSIGQGAW
jgi:hypothetical protein